MTTTDATTVPSPHAPVNGAERPHVHIDLTAIDPLVEEHAPGGDDAPEPTPIVTTKTAPVALPQAKTNLLERAEERARVTRRPIISPWFKTSAGRRRMIQLTVDEWWYRARARAVALLLKDVWWWLWWAACGALRLMGAIGGYAVVAEQRDYRRDARGALDHKSGAHWNREFKAAMGRRIPGVAFGFAALIVIFGVPHLLVPWWPNQLALINWAVPWWVKWSVYVLTGRALVRYGKPVDRPMVTATVPKQLAPRISAAGIGLAFGALGIAILTKLVRDDRADDLFQGHPIMRTAVGWQADMIMPLGVTAEEVVERRKLVAGNLRRKIGQVWLFEQGSDHPGALRLTVLDRPFSETPLPPWPLMKARNVSILNPLPFGYTQSVEAVDVTLFESNFLAGGLQGAGKTSALIILAAGAVLDPRVIPIFIELAGKGDYSAFEKIAHRYVSGPARDDDLQQVIGILRELDHDLEASADALKAAIAAGKAPDRKVTEELASTVPELRPRFVLIDEIAELFTEKAYAKDAEKLMKSILRRGRAFGWIFLLGIQNPDARSIPLGIIRLLGTRYCLRVDGQVGNDAVLGTSSYKMGHRATLLSEEDRGVGLLKIGATVSTVRAGYLTTKQIADVVRRAYAVREPAGLLTGNAVGQELDLDRYADDHLQIIHDCLNVWHVAGGDAADAKVTGGPSCWLYRLQEELAKDIPARYGDLRGHWLSGRFREMGIKTRGTVNRRVDGRQEGRPGVTLAAIEKALDDADDD
jgi:S-DNA-T family DNA segregation ATPase FtsK/SpoIIIE